MSLAHEAATVGVLWKRDLRRFVRQRSRLVGALAQPLLFWLMIGGGMASTFSLKTAGDLGYMEYFFPGILVMMVLFASIFGTITVIEDRNEGFLQSVLVGPGSRASIVLGKALGVASVGLVQASLFLFFLPWSGIDLGAIDWLSLAGFLVVSAVGLAAFGFALAWWINSSTGYHAIMSIVLLPAWVLSGAMFPVPAEGGVLASVIRYNPMSYMVNGVRQTFYETVPVGSTMGEAVWVDWAVVLGFAAFSLLWATRICYSRR